MKKILPFLMAVLFFLASVAGCTAVPQEPEQFSAEEPQIIGMPNPIQEAGSVDEINDIVGCCLRSTKDIYENISDESFSVINGTPSIAQYRFSEAGIPVTIRAAITKDDISGIFMADGKMPYQLLSEENPYEIIDTGYGLWSRWFLGGMQYSLQVGDGADYSDCLEAAYSDNLNDVLYMFRDFEALSYPWYEYSEEDMTEYPDISDPLIARGELATLNDSLSSSFGTGSSVPFASLSAHPGDARKNTVTVSDVDSFLNAIAPDTEIILSEGTYLLSEAAGYGTSSSKYYRWEDAYDGFELVINNVKNLTIRGTTGSSDDSDGSVRLLSSLCASPRYAEVIRFRKCSDILLCGVIVGHTEGGECCGGVTSYENCNNISVTGCELYGCGTYGIEGYETKGITVSDSIIHDCTYGFTEINNCSGISFSMCSFLNTSGYSGCSFLDSGDVLFTDCDFAYAYFDQLFDVFGKTSVSLNNCLIAYVSGYNGLLCGTPSAYEVNGGAYVDYGMESGQYSEIAFG